MSKKKIKTLKSSSAEYLTFIASGGESESALEIRYEEENIWLTQKLMAEEKNYIRIDRANCGGSSV